MLLYCTTAIINTTTITTPTKIEPFLINCMLFVRWQILFRMPLFVGMYTTYLYYMWIRMYLFGWFYSIRIAFNSFDSLDVVFFLFRCCYFHLLLRKMPRMEGQIFSRHGSTVVALKTKHVPRLQTFFLKWKKKLHLWGSFPQRGRCHFVCVCVFQFVVAVRIGTCNSHWTLSLTNSSPLFSPCHGHSTCTAYNVHYHFLSNDLYGWHVQTRWQKSKMTTTMTRRKSYRSPHTHTHTHTLCACEYMYMCVHAIFRQSMR